MKNLKVVFALVFATIFMLTSCQKDQIEDVQTTQQISADGTYLSGEELPAIESIGQKEISNIRQNQITSFAKEKSIGDMEFTATETAQSRSRTITDIECGDTVQGTTRGETNTVSVYSGADKVYLLTVDQDDVVTVNLSRLRADLDLFVTTVVKDGFGRKLIGDFLASSVEGGNSEEEVVVELDEGEYFIIVESFDGTSDFELSVACEIGSGPFTHCEDYQALDANYTNGISDQSDLWNLWTSGARDGLVLHETSTSPNKVVKIDHRRFGYQDVVRDIIGLPLTSGVYEMNFDLFTTSGVAEFLSEKTSNYGQEQGFKIKIDNDRLAVSNNGRTQTANTRIRNNAWHNVHMFLNMQDNEISIFMDGILILMDADAQLGTTRNGRKAIQGINFFGTKSNSKFHVDNVCITEHVPGYDDPIMVTIGGYEIIDMRY